MLRELVPTFESHVGPRPAEKALMRRKMPGHAVFRPGSDFEDVVAAVRAQRSLVVEASPGAGKSTRLPARLAQALGKLVVHVFPNERLADHVYRYMVAQGMEVQLMLSVGDRYPSQGVAVVSAACLVAKWLEAGEVVLPECVVYHDESHESDAYTYLVKSLALECSAVVAYVQATATPAAAGHRTVELAGTVSKGHIDSSVSSWDPFEPGQPWSVDSLRGNTMLFVDSRTAAASLVDAYASANFTVFRLTSRTPLDEFRRAEAAAADPNGPIVIFIVDSSYRSGFTFDMSTVVDSARVSYMEVVGNRPIRRERPAFQLEVLQAAARCGRVRGQVVKYFAPRGPFESKICDLESVEAEAVVLIMRVLGYAVPREFEQFRFATCGVPRDLSAALRSQQPLALVHQDTLVSLGASASPARSRSPFLAENVEVSETVPLDVKDPRVSADVARAYGDQGLRSGGGFVWSERWQDDLAHLVKVERGVTKMEIGRAYYASGLPSQSTSSLVFPDGVDSVIRFVTGDVSGHLVLGLDDYHKSVAVNLLLAKQQAFAAEMDGIGRALRAAREDGRSHGTVAASQLAMRVAERLTSVSSELSVVNSALMRLGVGFCSFHQMDINVAISDEHCAAWLTLWQALPAAESQAPQLTNYGLSSAYAARALELGVGAAAQRYVERPYVAMPAQGKGMRAVGWQDTPPDSSSGGSASSVSSQSGCDGQVFYKKVLGRTQLGKMSWEKHWYCERCGPVKSKHHRRGAG